MEPDAENLAAPAVDDDRRVLTRFRYTGSLRPNRNFSASPPAGWP